MLYEIGLLCTVGLGLWVLADVAGARPRRLQALPTALLGASCALWAGGELLIAHAEAPGEILLSRRLLYLGTAVLPVAWAWAAADAARVRWLARAPWLVALPATPQALIYALLYTDAHAWFVNGTAQPPEFGPLFWAHAAIGWSLITVGTCYFLLAAIRLGKASSGRMLAIVVGTSFPLLANLFYLTTSQFQTHADPTPLLLAVGILVIRLAAIDSGLTSFLPVARKDVIEQLQLGVLVADLEGKIVDANPAAAGIVGETKLAGASLEEVLARAQSDRTRAVEVEKFPVKGLVGEVGYCTVLRDCTEARRLEQQLHQAQKLEAIGYLTAGIAHGINNPLAFLNSNLGSLAELAEAFADDTVQAAVGPKRADLAAEAPEIVAEMRDGLDRIAHLVETLMGFSRSTSPEEDLVQVDLLAVAEKANALAAVGAASDAIRASFEPVPRVLGREDEFVQIATNLLLNAIQASGDDPQIELEVRLDRGQVALSVRDRGPGIPDDSLPHVFDPFFTTKGLGGGTGLGLSLSFDLARRHGGTLEAANRAGGGAEFTLWLPPAPGNETDREGLDPSSVGAKRTADRDPA
jgi:signal transduction histidine kinase